MKANSTWKGISRGVGVVSIASLFLICGLPKSAMADDASGKQARVNWVLQQRLVQFLHTGCTPNVDWPNSDLFKLICDDDGYALMALQYKDGSSPSILPNLQTLGFKAVLLTQSHTAIIGSQPDTYLVITSTGLAHPSLKTISPDPSPLGRWEYVELRYAQYRLIPDCQASLFSAQNDGIYAACPRFTSDWIEKTLSATDIAMELYRRGFRLVIYGDQQHFWPATITESGFVRSPLIDGPTLFKQYAIKTAAMVAAKENKDDAYQQYLGDTVRKLIDYAVKRNYIKAHVSAVEFNSTCGWSGPVDDSERGLFGEVRDRYWDMVTKNSEANLEKDLDEQAKIYFTGGKWEPYSGTMARYYIVTKPGSKDAPTLHDVIQEIRAATPN
jgi:hypothetical protein